MAIEISNCSNCESTRFTQLVSNSWDNVYTPIRLKNLKFCLEATVWQAKDTLERCKQLLKAKEDLKKKVSGVKGSNKLTPIVDLLLEKMLINVSDVRAKFSITYPTALKLLNALADLGVIRPLTDYSPKTYYAPDLFSITYRDLGGFDD